MGFFFSFLKHTSIYSLLYSFISTCNIIELDIIINNKKIIGNCGAYNRNTSRVQYFNAKLIFYFYYLQL